MRLIIICFILGIVQFSYAQKNAVYLEALGNGGHTSLNLEQQILAQPLLLFRIGIGITQDNVMGKTRPALITVPSSLHYLIDLKKNNYLDLSVGLSWFDAADEGPASGVTLLFTGLGFRRNFGKNWFFRGHLSPYVKSLTNSSILPEEPDPYVGLCFFCSSNPPQFYRYPSQEATFGFSIGKRF